MIYENYVSQRARRLMGSLGRQTSVPIEGLINLGSGTPDFLPPQQVLDAMQEAIASGRIQYTAWTGIPELRQAIAEKLQDENDLSVDPDTQLMVTSGAQEALMVTLMTLMDEGDNVITPSPHYDEYSRDAKVLGGELIPVVTTPESNFTIDVNDLESAITDRTKALIYCVPQQSYWNGAT